MHRLGWLVIVAFCLPTFPSTAAERKPNIVFILADDLGYAELGSYGQKKIRTPNLDRLASQGMRFTQHYCGNAVCAPSRCVLMTGKHPGHAFVRDNGTPPLPSSEVTVAEILREQGYATGGFGKWGMGRPTSVGDATRQGFDRFFGYYNQGRAHSYYPAYLMDGARKVPLRNDPPVPGHAKLPDDLDPTSPASYAQYKGTDYASDRIFEQLMSFVRANKDRPFFVYYPTIIPHLALHVPDEDLKPYLALGWEETPFTAREKGYGYTPHLTPRAAYAAMITRLDRYVGRLLALLDELKLTDHTLVVFTSDNGTTFLKREVDYAFFESVGALRGLKGSLYEGGIRVPAIVRWPGQVEPGSTTAFVSGFEDWLPTLAAVAGAGGKMPTGIDGISLLPTLLGKEQAPREFLYREFRGSQIVRVGKWKAVWNNVSKGNTHIELYNLETDVGEREDLAAKYPDMVAKMRRVMQEQHVSSKYFPLTKEERAAKAASSKRK
jgi:arylsulfatase A-like enzyme